MTNGGADAIDALYQVPLDRFTAERNALASALRKAGDRAQADLVKALSKPATTAWAVNQAWWRHQAAFTAMLEAGAQLRAAHHTWSHDRTADVRAAVAARQRAVNTVIEAAVDALGGPRAVTPDARHSIAGTVEGLASGGVPDGLVLGRLATAVQATGLEALSALAGFPAPPQATPLRPTIVARTSLPAAASPAHADARTRAAEAAREKALVAATARVAEREAALHTAVADLELSATDEHDARAAHDAATQRVAAFETQLELAQNDERAARRMMSRASKTKADAEMTRARAARDAAIAREQLDGLR